MSPRGNVASVSESSRPPLADDCVDTEFGDQAFKHLMDDDAGEVGHIPILESDDDGDSEN